MKTQLQLLKEFSESAIQKIIKKFSNESDEKNIRFYIDNFEKYKNGIQKKDPFQYSTFMEFEQAVDAAKGKSEFKKRNLANKGKPKEFINKQDELSEAIADDENITIFKGDEEHKCVKYGKGYDFCISRPSGGNMFASYRLEKASTFYFIFFKKIPKSDPKHIMVLDRTNKGWEWTFADNNTQEIDGEFDKVVKEFPVLKKYENLFQNKPLTSKERDNYRRLEDFYASPSLEQFNSFDYELKTLVVKSGRGVTNDIFDTFDKDLINEYISVGPNLTTHQADSLKGPQIERYIKVRKTLIPQLLESGWFKASKLDEGLSEFVKFVNGRAYIDYTDKYGTRHRHETDERYNTIHYTTSRGYEAWNEYDDNDRLIRRETGDGDEVRYDSKGRLVYEKNRFGQEYIRKYDDQNRIRYYKQNNGEYWYDENGKVIDEIHHSPKKDSFKNESINNNMITQKDLLTEGFWGAFGGGVKALAKAVAPEAIEPFSRLKKRATDVGSAISKGWKGPEGQISDKLKKEGYKVNSVVKAGKNWKARVQRIEYDSAGNETLKPEEIKIFTPEMLDTSSRRTTPRQQRQGVFNFNGKKYTQDYSSNTNFQRDPNTGIVTLKVLELDSNGRVYSSLPQTMKIDANGQIISVT